MVAGNEKYGKSKEDYLSSPFYLRKLRSCFNAMDVDSNGYLSAADYDTLAERAINLQETHERDDKIRKNWRDIFTTLIASNIQANDDTKVSYEQLVDNVASSFSNHEEAGKLIGAAFDDIFDIIDTNHDGEISPAEFRKYHEIYFGRHFEEQTDVCFKTIDVNGDGIISREEFITSILDYCFEAFGDENTTVLPFGPLEPQ